MPSIDFTGALAPAPQAAALRVESEPPGAEARVAMPGGEARGALPPGADQRGAAGPSCRTPCALQVPASGEFTVSFALNGFLPQTIPVRALTLDYREGGGVRFDPSPVFVQLEPAPPPTPPPGARKKKPRPPKTATSGITPKPGQ
jgi:hypothetical protein